MGGMRRLVAATLLVMVVAVAAGGATAQLRRGYYAGVCPDVETIVRTAVAKKYREIFVTVGATLRLFFHDCFVQGCDASVMIASTANNTAEKDAAPNLFLGRDGFDTVIRARAAVDAVPRCRNRVSCADVLVMATRDAISLAGGPAYAVELGRLDGMSSTARSVAGRLPSTASSLDQLTTLFASHGLSQTDMIALSGAHTVGLAHCSSFSARIHGPSPDPTLRPPWYVEQLRDWCPQNPDPRVLVAVDAMTPRTFDNEYFKNLQSGMGLLSSDQLLFTDPRSRPTVNAWARSGDAFNRAFVAAITKMGRVGVKTAASQGNIRHDCAVFN